MSKLFSPSLFFCHLLFLTGLFRAGGIHDGSVRSFVGAPFLFGGKSLPVMGQTPVQGLVFLLGLFCAGGFLSALLPQRGPRQRLRERFLLGLLLLGEAYFVVLDCRLGGRFWQLLLVLSLVYFLDNLDCSRLAFAAIPASGPAPLLGLVLVPLYFQDGRHRQVWLGLSVLVLFLQGHWAWDIDLTILSMLMLVTLFWEPSSWESSRPVLILAAVLSFLIGVLLYDSAANLKTSMEFSDETGSHSLVVMRSAGKVSLLADGQELNGPWNVKGRLYCNPYYFTLYPGVLGREFLYDSFGRQLQSRYSLQGFRYTIQQGRDKS